MQQHGPAEKEEDFEIVDPLDNPDQRIVEDATSFCSTTWNLWTSLLSSLTKLVIYVPMLWRLSPKSVYGLFQLPGWMVYAALMWSVFGSYLVHSVGRVFISLDYARQRYQADYRYELVNVRNNAESIAMVNGEQAISGRLENAWDHFRRVVWENNMFNKRWAFVMSIWQQTEWV